MKLTLAAFAAVALTLAGAASANDFDHRDQRGHREEAHQRMEHRGTRTHRDARDDHTQREGMADAHHDDQQVH
ncbi:hypothetical protein R75461_08492 [Paraburkholderia nemoris]|uniref:hypothetical protein n=1 Tax=Paraburkholderia nemoris TaxID=2793076 RepID=UPI00190B02A7|nr:MULTISPECIES: hypothetical protein [Paraburkholderia]MBK3787242.1 hypothetical protein [Paraburkholderia aspalathi]CAE6869521.1 hypothetical protein R75461_08492 [Paraburkholderia nemoris]